MDPYIVLEISQNATETEIKKAYRKLSLKYHPDKGSGTSEEFQKVCDAYNRVMDKVNETQLLKPCSDCVKDIHSVKDLNGVKDIHSVKDFKSVNPNIVSTFHPPPIKTKLILPFCDSIKGGLFPVQLDRKTYFQTGEMVIENFTLYVDVKSGIDNNEIIYIYNEGDNIYDLIKGDVKIVVEVINNTDFTRKGLDLLYQKTITLKEALCGFQFQLKLPNGRLYTINNKPGNIISPQYCKVIDNVGITRDKHCGNLIISFQILFPDTLSLDKIHLLDKIL